MVIFNPNTKARERGYMMAELFVAIAMLLGALLPIGYSFMTDKRVARATYDHAVAMEIVDGEMEVLLAGEWRAFTPGTHPYPVKGVALTNLPPGQFTLTLETNKVRLEWKPAAVMHGGPIVREAQIK
jgi:hypothetical protein